MVFRYARDSGIDESFFEVKLLLNFIQFQALNNGIVSVDFYQLLIYPKPDMVGVKENFFDITI